MTTQEFYEHFVKPYGLNINDFCGLMGTPKKDYFSRETGLVDITDTFILGWSVTNVGGVTGKVWNYETEAWVYLLDGETISFQNTSHELRFDATGTEFLFARSISFIDFIS